MMFSRIVVFPFLVTGSYSLQIYLLLGKAVSSAKCWLYCNGTTYESTDSNCFDNGANRFQAKD